MSVKLDPRKSYVTRRNKFKVTGIVNVQTKGLVYVYVSVYGLPLQFLTNDNGMFYSNGEEHPMDLIPASKTDVQSLEYLNDH